MVLFVFFVKTDKQHSELSAKHNSTTGIKFRKSWTLLSLGSGTPPGNLKMHRDSRFISLSPGPTE